MRTRTPLLAAAFVLLAGSVFADNVPSPEWTVRVHSRTKDVTYRVARAQPGTSFVVEDTAWTCSYDTPRRAEARGAGFDSVTLRCVYNSAPMEAATLGYCGPITDIGGRERGTMMLTDLTSKRVVLVSVYCE